MSDSNLVALGITIIGILGAAIFTMFGFFFKRNENLHQLSQQTLQKQNEALMVLSARVEPAIKQTETIGQLQQALKACETDIKKMWEIYFSYTTNRIMRERENNDRSPV